MPRLFAALACTVLLASIATTADAAAAASCEGGFELKDFKCVPCAANTWSSEGSNKCQPCPAGTSSPPAGSPKNYCVSCTYNTYGAKPGAGCKPCPKGTYSITEGATACTACKKKTVLDFPGRACNDYIVCEPGKATYKGVCKGKEESICFYYPTGCCVPRTNDKKCLYKPGAAPPKPPPAVKCKGGYELKGGKCVPCAANTWSSEGANKCQPCPAGTSSPPAGSPKNYCVSCTYNTYGAKPGAGCKPCPVGTYSITEGATACTACKKKTVLDFPGRACNDYLVCEPGKATYKGTCTGKDESICYYYPTGCCVPRTDDKKCLYKP